MLVWCGGACLALVCTACGAQKLPPPSSRFVAWSQQDPDPKRVCVLPFSNRTGRPAITGQVRRSFAGHLSTKRFVDVELHEIDARLPPDWRGLSARSLGETLGCQALVYGVVTQARRLYLGLYAGIALDAGIRLIDARSGRSLVEESYTTRFRSGGLPLSPIGIVPNAVLLLRDISDAQIQRAIDDLARNLAARVPDLPYRPLPASPAREEMAELPPAAPEATRQAQPGPASYRLQVATFDSSESASSAVRLLRRKGYQAELLAPPGLASRWYQVVLGPFPSAASAKQVGAAIRQDLPFFFPDCDRFFRPLAGRSSCLGRLGVL